MIASLMHFREIRVAPICVQIVGGIDGERLERFQSARSEVLRLGLK